MPAGTEVTDPLPDPAGLMNRLNGPAGVAENVATQLRFVETTILVLAAVPVQLPDQPENVEPVAATAVSTTDVFATTAIEHVVPQLMPEGAEVIVPLPLPARLAASVSVGGGGGGSEVILLNVAVQVERALTTMVVVAVVPEQAPDQPAKTESTALAAVNRTESLLLTRVLQSLPQEMPDGIELTLPLPVPALTTASR